MNRVISKLIFILLLAGYVSYGQQYSVLKADVLGPIRGRFGVTYEQNVRKVFSAQLALEWGIYGRAAAFGDEYTASGYAIIPEIRYYPLGAKNLNIEPFIGAAFRYAKFFEEYQISPAFAYVNIGTLKNYGLDIGCRFRHKRIWAELLVGRGTGDESYDYNEISNYIPKILSYDLFLFYERRFFRLEISVGYVFQKLKKESKE